VISLENLMGLMFFCTTKFSSLTSVVAIGSLRRLNYKPDPEAALAFG
jgi:hypothetical protein